MTLREIWSHWSDSWSSPKAQSHWSIFAVSCCVSRKQLIFIYMQSNELVYFVKRTSVNATLRTSLFGAKIQFRIIYPRCKISIESTWKASASASASSSAASISRNEKYRFLVLLIVSILNKDLGRVIRYAVVVAAEAVDAASRPVWPEQIAKCL